MPCKRLSSCKILAGTKIHKRSSVSTVQNCCEIKDLDLSYIYLFFLLLGNNKNTPSRWVQTCQLSFEMLFLVRVVYQKICLNFSGPDYSLFCMPYNSSHWCKVRLKKKKRLPNKCLAFHRCNYFTNKKEAKTRVCRWCLEILTMLFFLKSEICYHFKVFCAQ